MGDGRGRVTEGALICATVKRVWICLGTVAVLAVALCGGAEAATPIYTGSLSVADAGGGSMTVTVSASATGCTEFCSWFTSVQERHSALPCVDDHVFIRALSGLHSTGGPFVESATFRPFFPRAARLCLYVNGSATPTAEFLYTVPTGYGDQRSTAYNCPNFGSQSAAEYYLELYPGDPSRLDADHDGAACEDNPCPCGAEAVPPEPEPAPPVLPAPATAPTTTPSACAEGEAAVVRAWHRVTRARQRMRAVRGTRAAPRRKAEWQRTVREARQTERQQDELCG